MNKQKQSKRQNTYYFGLYDLDKVDRVNEDGANIYKKVEWRKSGNQEYFIMLHKNLQERGNWYELNDVSVFQNGLIDFSFTNWAKIQTQSVIHNRILFDLSGHFVSNKWHYYNTFKDEEFIPMHQNITDANTLPYKMDDHLLLKPATGSLSIGIKILNSHNTRDDIIEHMSFYKQYTNWTITELYIAKRWIDGCIVSNRIYYLVRKLIIKGQVYITGYWYDECIHYKAFQKYNENETDYQKIMKQLITNMSNNETTAQDFFNKRVLTHSQYLTLFEEEEYNIVKQKITDYLSIITNKIGEHVTCANDYLSNYNDETDENKNMSFHLYGVDSLITDELDVKFIEINGAPSIIYDAGINHIHYNVMMDEMLKLTADVLYPPNKNVVYDGMDKRDPHYGRFKNSNMTVKMFNRKFIECGSFTKTLKTPIYIAKQICDTYPFILNALFNEKRSQIYQRIKNPHSNNIFLFYGLRDRYIRDQSSLNYYDELIEYRISNNSRNSKILNKIQGITYYLASKDRLYYNCYDINNNFIPYSIIFNIDTNKMEDLEQGLCGFNAHNNKYIIIKPVYGSQGKGIIIVPVNSSVDAMFNNMMSIKLKMGYSIFILSVYIDNPKLYTDVATNKCKIKFNLRFYAFLHITKLATYQDTKQDIHYYTLKDVQIYFAVLPYDVSMNINELTKTIIYLFGDQNNNGTINIELYDKIKQISLFDINNLINLTNLQIVKNLSTQLNIPISLSDFVSTLQLMNYDDDFKKNVFSQADCIIKQTINSVKHDIRHLNRFIDGSSAFNLIAYDTMLDADDKLHLIEINRGPDLHGLKLTLGEEKITDIFTEIFDVVIDNKPEQDLKHFTKYAVDF